MAERRRYTRRQKVVAINAAIASSLTAAAEAQDVPKSTLKYWLDSDEFAQLRTKTREQIAEGSMVLAQMAQAELQRKMAAGELDGKDLAVVYGIAIDKAQLLAGAATARIESRDLTDSFDDHEKARLREILDGVIEEPAEAGAGGDTGGAGAEVRQ